eukprot:GDKJ01018722.1.p1 GENE.GDKJ01018722.1~~GDKJ01018722.1.p1  ORF type:complete len:543 (-),score=121.02 GDKJ01018722.1:111-1739(-)
MGIMNWLREVDFFKKLVIDSDYFSPIKPSRFATFIQWSSTFVALLLFIIILSEFKTGVVEQQFLVDSFDAGRLVRITLNVTLPNIPCVATTLDFVDAVGTHGKSYSSTVFKERVFPNGTIIDDEKKDDFCGECYGAELYDGQCCNTCDDIIAAYRLRNWSAPIHTFDLCQVQQDGGSPTYRSSKTNGDFKEESLVNLDVDADFPSSPNPRASEEATDEEIDAWSDNKPAERDHSKAGNVGEEMKEDEEKMVDFPSTRSTPPANRRLQFLLVDETQKLTLERFQHEGCRVWGFFDVKQVPGEFQLGPANIQLQAWRTVFSEDFQAKVTVHTLRWTDARRDDENLMRSIVGEVPQDTEVLKGFSSLPIATRRLLASRQVQHQAASDTSNAFNSLSNYRTLDGLNWPPSSSSSSSSSSLSELLHVRLSVIPTRLLTSSPNRMKNEGATASNEQRGFQFTSSVFALSNKDKKDDSQVQLGAGLTLTDPTARAKAGVYFEYEFDPVLVSIKTKKETVSQLLITVCGVVGGAFALANFILKANALISK